MLSQSTRKVKTTGLKHFCIIHTKCLVIIPNLMSARCFLTVVSEIKVQPDTVGMTLTPVNICKRKITPVSLDTAFKSQMPFNHQIFVAHGDLPSALSCNN